MKRITWGRGILVAVALSLALTACSGVDCVACTEVGDPIVGPPPVASAEREYLFGLCVSNTPRETSQASCDTVAVTYFVGEP
jgi:hypothetical protein